MEALKAPPSKEFAALKQAAGAPGGTRVIGMAAEDGEVRLYTTRPSGCVL